MVLAVESERRVQELLSIGCQRFRNCHGASLCLPGSGCARSLPARRYWDRIQQTLAALVPGRLRNKPEGSKRNLETSYAAESGSRRGCRLWTAPLARP